MKNNKYLIIKLHIWPIVHPKDIIRSLKYKTYSTNNFMELRTCDLYDSFAI